MDPTTSLGTKTPSTMTLSTGLHMVEENAGTTVHSTLLHEEVLTLNPLAKMGLVAMGAAIVACTVLLVICWLQRSCSSSKGKRSLEKANGGTYGSAEKIGIPLQAMSGSWKDSSPFHHLHAGAEASSPPPLPGENNASVGKPTHVGQGITYTRQDSTCSRQDSTYSSMSSGRTSPSSTRSIALSASSIPECSSPPTEKVACPPPTPSITISLLLTYSSEGNQNTGAKLAIAVESVSDLPYRDYGAHCDPWVGVTVMRDRRSLRRRPSTHLAFFRTKTIRHAHNPFYSQTFIADLQKSEIKDVSVRFTVMDQDRHIGAQEMGRASMSLKEAKQTVQEPERITITLMLQPLRREKGEIQVGLTYLPTAQRLSFTIQKVFNIRLDSEEMSGHEKLNPYVKILLFSPSGRLVKKKKTAVMYDTKEPAFQETINVEVEGCQIENLTVLIVLCSKANVDLDEGLNGLELGADSSDQESPTLFNYSVRSRKGSQARSRDLTIGKISIGKNVRSEKGRDHWRNVLENPRKVFTVNHTFK